MHPLEFLEDKQYVLKWDFTGSRVICDPPPMDTDQDIIILCGFDPHWILTGAGYVQDGDEKYNYRDGIYEFGFRSYRWDQYNLIITCNQFFYDSFVEATEEAKKLNLLDKNDRIALFQKIHDVNHKKYLDDLSKVRMSGRTYCDKLFMDYGLDEEFALDILNKPAVKPWQALNEFYGKKRHAK